MASLDCGVRSAAQVIHGFHRPSFRADVLNTITFFNRERQHLSFRTESLDSGRSKNVTRLQLRRSSVPVFASKTNPSEGSDVAKISDESGAQGPPFLTILAGLFVFFVVCWIIGSIVLWFVGLIVNPPSK